MATIAFNAPESLASHLNVALSDGRFMRLEDGVHEYAEDAAYLLKKSTNPAIQRYIAAQVITIQMDEAEGVKSVLMGSQATPFAPLSASDLGFIGPTGISTAGMGRPTVPGLSTPSPGQVITPTRTPGREQQQLSPEQLAGLGDRQPITPDMVNQQPLSQTEESLSINALNASAAFTNSVSGSNVGQVAGDGVFNSKPSAVEPAPSLDDLSSGISQATEGPPPLSSLAQPSTPAPEPKPATKRKATRKSSTKKAT